MGVERAAALICGWLATYFIHSTLLLGVTWVSTRRLPSRFDSLSELIWRGALVLPIVTALTQSVFPSIRLLEPANVGGIEYSPQPLTIMHVPSWVWIGGATLWLLGALAGLGQLIACHRRLRRQIADRTTLPGEVWRVIRPLIATDDVRVSVVHDLAIPFALMREICLPSWLPDRMSHAELRAVVAHELSHVRRRDAFWRIVTAAVRRAFFFQPLNWVAVTRLRELSECICDDEAIAATSSPVPLASALERVASRAIKDRAGLTLAPGMGGGGGGGAPVSFTVKRIGRILSMQTVPQRVRVALPQQIVALIFAAMVAVFYAPRVTLPVIGFLRYTIDAQDPAGHFTVTLEKGRVVGATIAGRALEQQEVRQNGASIQLLDRSGVLSLRMTPAGGIRWDARKSTVPGM